MLAKIFFAILHIFLMATLPLMQIICKNSKSRNPHITRFSSFDNIIWYTQRPEKTISRLEHHRFFQKLNESILVFCFTVPKYLKLAIKFVCLFFGRIFGAPICFWFYLTFSSFKFQITVIGENKAGLVAVDVWLTTTDDYDLNCEFSRKGRSPLISIGVYNLPL